MKCKDCTEMICAYRTTDGERECYYQQYADFTVTCPNTSGQIKAETTPNGTLTDKELWISDMIVKLIASIPYEFVTSCNGQINEPRHLYAARIAKEMADQIFG